MMIYLVSIAWYTHDMFMRLVGQESILITDNRRDTSLGGNVVYKQREDVWQDGAA